MGFTFYNSVAKVLKTKSQKVLGANSNVCRSYKGKTVRGAFLDYGNWCYSRFFILKVIDVVLVILLLTLNTFTLFSTASIVDLLWTSKC